MAQDGEFDGGNPLDTGPIFRSLDGFAVILLQLLCQQFVVLPTCCVLNSPYAKIYNHLQFKM